jgi:hypothetical protein
MKRNLLGILVSVCAASALVAAQSTSAGSQSQMKPATPVTLTGCLVQGSSPTVFRLNNARTGAQGQASQETMAKGKDYVLVSATEDLNFRTYLNHEVSVTGSSAGAQAKSSIQTGTSEKDLPKIQVKSISNVADRCTSASQ